jgi:hypothetical protein
MGHPTLVTLAAPALLAAACSGRVPVLDDSALSACSSGTDSFMEEAVQVSGAVHTTAELTFGSQPPTGGPHNPCWSEWGVHDEPVEPKYFVHNLEHGGVALLYNCPDGCAEEVTWLSAFTALHELVILTPYPALGTRFGLSAWEARASGNCLDPGFVESFYERRVDRAPEQFGRPPPGPPSSCR